MLIVLHVYASDIFNIKSNVYLYSKLVFVLQGPPRLSNLEAPIMLLTGHEGDIFTAKFSPDGQMLASSGFDRLICK